MFRILDPPPRPKPYGDPDAVHILEILERHLGSGKRTGRDFLPTFPAGRQPSPSSTIPSTGRSLHFRRRKWIS